MRSEIQTSAQPKRSFIEEARRAQIIECAIATIAELGYGQASLAQIAKRAGISTGVISYHFAGKDDLIRAVGAHVYATGEAIIRPVVDAQETARGALRTFILANVAFLASHPAYGRTVMNIIRAGRDERGAPLLDPHVDEPRRGGFQQILQWGQSTGEFRPFSATIMAVTIIEALDAALVQLAQDPDLDMTAYAEELATLFDLGTQSPASGDPR
jgi:TetR/AcrR family fatty acid metabolism transcriptional regulator